MHLSAVSKGDGSFFNGKRDTSYFGRKRWYVRAAGNRDASGSSRKTRKLYGQQENVTVLGLAENRAALV